jgi:putative Mg2+ transporter-C (MgtC) family protein
MNIINEDILKILLAALLGAVLGFERQWRSKPAGLRTVMLVSIGSCLFTLASYKTALLFGQGSDSTRIASNIVTGIGFIGAGIIFRSEQNVHGLTTAATVWAVAALGMLSGIGSYGLAIETTVVLWFILEILQRVEKMFEKKWESRQYEVRYKNIGDHFLKHGEFFDNDINILSSKMEKAGDEIRVTWTIRTSANKHNAAVQKMLKDNRITAVDY